MLQILRKDTQKKSAIRTAVNEGRWKVKSSVINGYLIKQTFEVFFGLKGILKLDEGSSWNQTSKHSIHNAHAQFLREIRKREGRNNAICLA
jgi:hypothetical protein